MVRCGETIMSKASRMDNWRHLLVYFSLVSTVGCTPQSSGNVWQRESAPPQECRNGCDQDGDSILDAQDNCPEHPNTDQDDQDHDGRGDSCDDEPNTPNYRIRESSIERTPAMSDGAFVLRTQTRRTLHKSDDGQYRLTVGNRP